MPKIIISIDGVVVKEVQLTKDRTTLGRRPYNDVVIDNLAVSGEHAVLQMSGSDVHIEDLNSTNGTYVNGKAVKKQLLHHNDVIEVGKHRLTFLHEQAAGSAIIRITSGPAAGREVALVKVVTTVGKPGVAVASITRRPHGYVVALVEGHKTPTLNGQPLGSEPQILHHGDVLELAGTQMQFLMA